MRHTVRLLLAVLAGASAALHGGEKAAQAGEDHHVRPRPSRTGGPVIVSPTQPVRLIKPDIRLPPLSDLVATRGSVMLETPAEHARNRRQRALTTTIHEGCGSTPTGAC